MFGLLVWCVRREICGMNLAYNIKRAVFLLSGRESGVISA